MFGLSYDGICSFQYDVPEVEGEGLRGRAGFKDQPRLINWGKEYEMNVFCLLHLSSLKKIQTSDPDLKFKNPTRFPNNSAIVFDSFLIDLPAIVRSLEESQADEKNKNRMK